MLHPNLRRLALVALAPLVLGACAEGALPADPGPDPIPKAAGDPVASLSPSALAIAAGLDAGTLEVRNGGESPLEWALSGPEWVVLQPLAGTLAPGAAVQVGVTAIRTALAPGTHRGTLELQSNGGGKSATIEVEVAAPARIAASPGEIDLGADLSQATVALVNQGGMPLAWSARADVAWLSVSPATGTTAAGAGLVLSVKATRTGLSPGIHRAEVTIASNGGDAVVPVVLLIPDPGGSVALSGRVVDQFSGAGMPGLTVRYDGGTAVTAADGGFTVFGPAPASPSGLTIEGGSIHRRVTFARAGAGEWPVLPATFDIAAFDDMGREYEPRTIRWITAPHVYFDVTPPVGIPGPEVDAWIAETRAVLGTFVTEWTDGRLPVASVTSGTRPPPEGTPGTIVIRMSESPDDYPQSRTVGLARTFWSSDRAIYAGRILLRFSLVRGADLAWARRGVVGHELGHALGVGHMDLGRPSLMTPSISTSALTSFDRDVADVLYSRAPGTSHPDTEDLSFWRGALSPSSAPPAGSFEWVCGALAPH